MSKAVGAGKAAERRTVVLERRPLSPSIQTSEKWRNERCGECGEGRRGHTFCLNFVTLGEGEIGSEEVVPVLNGHVYVFLGGGGRRWRKTERRGRGILGRWIAVDACLVGEKRGL